MGLFSSSKSNSVTSVKTNNVDAAQNTGYVLSGIEGSEVTLTDQGAIKQALQFARDTGDQAINAATASAERAVAAVRDSGRAMLAGNESQISAISELAESVSVGDRETSAKLSMMMLGVVALMVVIIVFMVLR